MDNPAICKACGALMAFVQTSAGKTMPVNFSTLTEAEKIILRRGEALNYNKEYHISHFATCPAASNFRKAKK